MNTYNRLSSLGKAVVAGLLSSGVLLSATARAEVMQNPLSLSEGVAPNMIFTLDESGSMSWGHVPDNQPWNNSTWAYDSRRYRAANVNPMYYNPNVIYEIPPAFNTSGDEYTLTTSFTDAPVNGFLPNGTRGKVDLSRNYRVVREFRMPDGNFNLADHPSFSGGSGTCTVNIRDNNSTGSCEIEGTRVSVRRTSGGCDRVSPSSASYELEGKSLQTTYSCSRRSNTVTITGTSNLPAYYYEYDAELNSCTGNKDDRDGGGEACYRLRWVDETQCHQVKRFPSITRSAS